ncbi:hypothetical protein ACFPIF_15970 [Brevundimonas faecalis]
MKLSSVRELFLIIMLWIGAIGAVLSALATIGAFCFGLYAVFFG